MIWHQWQHKQDEGKTKLFSCTVFVAALLKLLVIGHRGLDI